MSKNVQLVKLVNNEFLIGDVTEDSVTITINKPFQIGVVENQIAFIDFNNQLEDGDALEVERHNILYTFAASEAVVTSYIERSTGIELATVGSLAPEVDFSDLS